MRELKVVGLDADGKNIICQGAIPSEQFKLPVDDRLRAALRDDSVQPEQAQLDIEVTNVLSPKEIQARIRPARLSNRSLRHRAPTSPVSAGLPTRYCWNARARPSWQPRRTRSWPTARRC